MFLASIVNRGNAPGVLYVPSIVVMRQVLFMFLASSHRGNASGVLYVPSI